MAADPSGPEPAVSAHSGAEPSLLRSDEEALERVARGLASGSAAFYVVVCRPELSLPARTHLKQHAPGVDVKLPVIVHSGDEVLEWLLGAARASAHETWSLAIRAGEVLPEKRVRGSQKALAEIVDLLAERTQDGTELRLGIAHADAPERAEALTEMVRRERPAAQLELVTMLGPVVGTHAGPGTVGFFWYHDR